MFYIFFLFFFKQKTAYEMRISDWSSDVCSSDLFKFRLISKATLDRRKKSASKRLTSEEGDKLARIAKVFSFALDIYKDPAKVRDFLGRAHPMLDNKPPLDVALATGPGADVVINLLGRARSEEHTSELQSLMRISYDVF